MLRIFDGVRSPAFKATGDPRMFLTASSRSCCFGVCGIIGWIGVFLIAPAKNSSRLVIGDPQAPASSIEMLSLDSLVRRNVAMGILSHLSRCLAASEADLARRSSCASVGTIGRSTSEVEGSEARNVASRTSSRSIDCPENISRLPA